VVDQAVVELDGGRLFFAAVVQRHLHVQLGLGIHALEVACRTSCLKGCICTSRSSTLAGLAVEFHVQDGGVEGFLLEGVPQGVVVQLDQLGLAFATVDDAGRAPVMRRRRLAPVPCFARSKATNFMIHSMWSPPRPV
jgi:hypothetical protein